MKMAMTWMSLAMPPSSMQRVNHGPINSLKQGHTASSLTTQTNQMVEQEMVRMFRLKLELHPSPFRPCSAIFGQVGISLVTIQKKEAIWPLTLER